VTFDRKVKVPVITGTGLRERVTHVTRHFTFADLTVMPLSIITDSWGRSAEAVMWAALEWALPAEQFATLDDMPLSAVRQQVSAWEAHHQITLEEMIGLARTIKNHPLELEADLIEIGLRLRNCPTPEFNWRDLYVIVKTRGPHSNLYAAVFPDKAGWDLPAQLAAEGVDVLRWLQWAKSEAAQDPSTMPKPIPRPGVGDDAHGEVKHRKMTLEQAKKIFDRPDPEREAKLFRMFR
jgi:hypothetical protein